MSISEQVKELREHGQIHKHNNRYTVDLLNQAAETIESLSAKLQAANMERSADCGGWIPCKERLPKEDGFYLATLDGEIVGEDKPFSGMAEFKDGKWVDDEKDYQCVIAWQTLPGPYQGAKSRKGGVIMKRLTERDEYGNADIVGVDSEELQCNLTFDEFNKVTDALNKLAQYEDLGLTPDQLKQIDAMYAQRCKEISDLKKQLAGQRGKNIIKDAREESESPPEWKRHIEDRFTKVY